MSAAITHTIVVEFAAGQSPTYYAGMEVLGGRVTAVAFDGDRLQVADELLEALQAMERKASKQNWNDQYPEELRAARDAITRATGAAA